MANIWFLLIPTAALLAAAFALAYLLIRALASLESANERMASLAHDTLTRPPAPIELPAPEVHFDFPTPPELAEPQTPTLAPDPFMVDPTDGHIPNINVDWGRSDYPDDSIDLPYIPDPADEDI